MAYFLRNFAALAFVFCFVKSSEAQAPNLSADDTVAYINTTLHKYPTLEFVDFGCPGYEQDVSISGDRRSLIIKQNFGRSALATCDDIRTFTVPVFSLNREGMGDWSKQGQHSLFYLDCINRTDCFSRRSNGDMFPAAKNQWYLQLTGPDMVSDHMKKAIQHLVESLLTEADSHLDGSDPFAKRAH